MSDFLNHFPYSDIHELNLDWIIKTVKDLGDRMNDFEAVNKIKYEGTWDITKQYEAWSIVEDGDYTYICIKPVPAGILLSNTDYWQYAGSLTVDRVARDGVINLNKELLKTNENVDEVKTDIAEINNELEDINTRFDTVNGRIDITNENIEAEAAARAEEDDVINARIDNIIALDPGSTTGDAELADIRVGANGVTYSTAGDAVRGQFNQLNGQLSNVINDLDEKSSITLEMGNINASTGVNVASTANFRTASYLPVTINKVSCVSFCRIAVYRYNLVTGAFIDRTAFTLHDYTSFDHTQYKYRISLRRGNDATIPEVRSDWISFESVISRENKFITDFNDNGFASVALEQGNISGANGANIDSTKNIRTVDYIPDNIRSVSCDENHHFCVAIYRRSNGSFVSRSMYIYQYYNDFNHDTYYYKIAMAEITDTADITPSSDGKYLYFNTETYDIIRKIEKKANDMEVTANNGGILLLNDYANANSYQGINRALKGTATFDDFMDNGFNYEDATLHSHDATIAIYNDKVYCIRAMFSSTDNANADDCKVVLTVSDLDGTNKVDTVIAKQGDTLGDYTIAGGAGSPNLILVGTDLHIFFTAHTDETFMIFHVEYDVTDDTLSTYEPITVNGHDLTVDICSELLGQTYSGNTFNAMQINASIGFTGTYYYIGLCAGTNDTTGRGAILKSSNLIDWTSVIILDKNKITPVYEIACWCDASNLIIATRSGYNKRKGYLAKYRLSDNVLLNECYFLNGCTRPDFVALGTTLLLLNSEDNTRNSVSIYKINKDNMILSEITHQMQRYTKTLQYLRGYAVSPSLLYGVCTCRDSSNKLAIHISELGLNLVSDADVHTIITGLIS